MYSAAILAGGRATRFGGRDKSTLVVGGRTIRERQLDALRCATGNVLVVEAARDIVPGCGPLGGIFTALTEARADAVFVVACDMPFITAELVQYLLDLTARADIVVPRTEDGYHPLCAAYTRACRDPIARRLAERRLKLSDLFEDVRTHAVSAADLEPLGGADRLLTNVNSAAEYARLEALQSHKG